MTLHIDNIHTSYGHVKVLHGVSLKIGEGQIVTLLGRNGMGKTTTIRAVTGLVPAKGTRRFAGRDLHGKPVHRIARAGIGLVPEGRRLFASLTVRENLLAAARPGAAFTLIDRITADGRARGMRWGLFTATRPLRHGLLRAGAGLIELGRADPGRLADAGCWGRYYETDPFVCAVAGDACMSRAAAQSASGQKAWGQKASGRTVSDARSTPSRSDRTAHA